MQNLLFPYFHLVICIISVFEMFLSFLMFFTYIFYTKKLSRLGLLIICKYLFLFFIFFLHLFYSINNLFNKNYSYSTKVISNFYLSYMFLLQVAINIQFYINMRNPCYILKYIFNNELGIIFFIIIILIESVFIAIVPYFFQNDVINIFDYIFSENNDDYFNIYYQDNKILSPIIIITFFGLLYLFFQIRKFYRNLKEKSLEHLKYSNTIFLVINILLI